MENVQNIRSNKLRHAYLIVSDSESKRNDLAGKLAAALLCEAGGEEPCMQCRHCKKATAKIHPDITYIGRENENDTESRRDILVDQIRDIVRDAYIMPNEARRKVYIIYNADAMNIGASNAILKILEEPPGECAFILTTAMPSAILETVISRCSVIYENARADEKTDYAAYEEAIKAAAELIKAIGTASRKNLLNWSKEYESFDNKKAADTVRFAQKMLADILSGRESHEIEERRCLHVYKVLSESATYLSQNTGVKHVFGYIAVKALEE